MNILKKSGVLLLIMLLSNCNLGDVLTTKDDLTLPEIEEFIGTPLPSEAINIHFATSAAIDRVVYLRFDLPKDGIPGLLSSLGITAPLGDNFKSLYNIPRLEWWQPDQVTSYQGTSQIINFMGYDMLVVELNDDTVTIYLRVTTL
jgi:hypothetical protein